jgi:Family of unknown function (DUF6424)
MPDNDSPTGTHVEHEDHPWTRVIPDHPERTDSPAYIKSRKKTNELAKENPKFAYGVPPYQDHHGGGLWLKDADGWFLIRNLFGIEWSAQFCADPKKVDVLRQNAKRIYANFPEAVAELGIAALLDHQIKTPHDVAEWTDSICNASVPLPTNVHTGVLPKYGGLHHYPAPVAEIAMFKYDDFNLWVTDDDKTKYAVVPVGPRRSGDGRVRLLYVDPPPRPGTRRRAPKRRGPTRGPTRGLEEAFEESEGDVLPASHRLARQAFRDQV